MRVHGRECLKASLATKVQSLGPTWGKEKRETLMMLSDLNMCSMTYVLPSFLPPSLSVCLSLHSAHTNKLRTKEKSQYIKPTSKSISCKTEF